VASVFGEFMSCDAIHIGGPGDEGIDLILVDGNRKYVVQVKRRSRRGATESVSSIREFVGAMVLKGEVRGLFISTAAQFSREAMEAAHTAGQIGVIEYLELVDVKRLLDVCRLTATSIPVSWHRALTKPEAIQEHLAQSFDAFMVMAMGHQDWRMEHASNTPFSPGTLE
jgi:restriction endonuclease Mrr